MSRYAKKSVKARRIRRRTTKKYYRKRPYVFRNNPIMRTGFPRTQVVKLKYVEGFTVDPGVGIAGTYAFRANSVYDPNATGTGHQPMNFDLWSQLYNHYVVIGAKIKVHVYPSSVAGNGGVVQGIMLTDDMTYTTHIGTIMENNLCRYRHTGLGPINSYNGVTVSKTFSSKKFFTITNITDNTGRIGSATNNNPTEQAFFVFFLGAPPDNNTDWGVHNCTAEIEYIVLFSEPKEQPQS